MKKLLKRLPIKLLIFFFMIFLAEAAEPQKAPPKKVIYENQTINFEGLSLEGELNAPGEFYFQNRAQERFDTLTKRRTNFRREMLRDAVQSN